jgi:glycosyltransferase involved in cell wall biosynthesis
MVMPSSSPAVSVVVPVYNPGRNIDECIASLLGQSMPAGELELIFVDDGSTDATPARLDALAAAHPHVRVHHMPNSGWPGRPRNVGVDMARGEYVYFVDNDDWLEPDAIERLHAAALADGADIVIGKVVGHGKRVPREMFRESLHAVAFDGARLLGLLTPHKLFRRGLLLEHGIRFPEGRRRLEDHMFVVHAYFHANGISVLADRPYYHWTLRDRGQNASYRQLDPEGYFGNVREVLDLVCEHTEPGALRDRLLTHWYRGKMLGRVGGGAFLTRDAEYGRALTAAIRALALERFGEDVHARLPFHLRVRSTLLRRGRYDGLERLADFERTLNARVKTQVRRDGDAVELSIAATLGGPELRRSGTGVAWIPPHPLREPLAGADLDVTKALQSSRVRVYLRSLADESEYLLPGDGEVAIDPDGELVRPALTARLRIDAATAAAGHPLPEGDWEVRTVITVAGFAHGRTARRNGAPLVLTCSRGRVSARRSIPRPLIARRLAAVAGS